ncbi:50S ribosomal protein L19 [Candidatus Microgenomates bacterium]|nr:50S ribosomal protein L19 [Candidatus Microgenomates bacterium]
MQEVITKFEAKYRKPAVAQVQSGDSVRVHQKVREGGKERVQVFEGVVIRTVRPNSLTASITVRRITSGIGVEKTYLLHSPNVVKVQVTKRGKVRRNLLSYMRTRTGRSARLSELGFDKTQVNVAEPAAPKTDKKSDEPKVAAAKADEVEKPTKDEAKEAEVAAEAKPTEDDDRAAKAAEKKAKAEAFRQAQEAKK